MPKGIYDHYKFKGNKHRLGKVPWNKGKKNAQVAWNKNLIGYMKGSKNGMYKDGLTPIQRREKLAGRERNTVCEICREISLTHFDHDHKTGKFRGWLCRRCNLVLGMVKDNPILLKNLALYLEIQYEYSRPKVISDALLAITNYAIYPYNSNGEDKKFNQEA